MRVTNTLYAPVLMNVNFLCPACYTMCGPRVPTHMTCLLGLTGSHPNAYLYYKCSGHENWNCILQLQVVVEVEVQRLKLYGLWYLFETGTNRMVISADNFNNTVDL